MNFANFCCTWLKCSQRKVNGRHGHFIFASQWSCFYRLIIFLFCFSCSRNNSHPECAPIYSADSHSALLLQPYAPGSSFLFFKFSFWEAVFGLNKETAKGVLTFFQSSLITNFLNLFEP